MTDQNKMRAALESIAEKAKPGQSIDIYQAIDILCEIYNEAKAALMERQAA